MNLKDSPIERYFAVIEAVAPFSNGLTASEIGTTLGLPKSTVSRMLGVLSAAEMVVSNEEKGKRYKMGSRLINIIRLAAGDEWISVLSKGPLDILVKNTGQTGYIAKLEGNEVKSVTCVAPDTPVRTYVMPGVTLPANVTAAAKAILAYQSDVNINEVFSLSFKMHTQNSISDISLFISGLKKIKRLGYATDLAEHVSGLGAIACPIFSPNGEVKYSVGLTGTFNAIVGDTLLDNLNELRITAEKIEKILVARER